MQISIPVEEIPTKFEINGKTYINTYKKFGSSAFGDIFQVRADDEKQDYILKRTKNISNKIGRDESFKMLQTEYDLLSIIAGCPNIIKLEGFSKDADHAMMLLEYAKGGDLHDYIEPKMRLNEKIEMKTFENLFIQLISAVKCFHLLGVYNLDIKPENIVFLDEKKTKLAIIDFGLAVKSADDKCIGFRGSEEYMAPEVNVKDAKDAKEYKCSKADIFSLGTVLSLLLSISKPVNKNENIYYQKMKILIEKMTHKDPEIRITLDDIVEEHGFFYFNINDDSDMYGQFKSKKRLCKSKTKKSKKIKHKSKSLRKSNRKKYNYPKK